MIGHYYNYYFLHNMPSNRNNSGKAASKKVNNSEPTVIDFGTRKVSNQNFSKMVALPKTALKNCSPDKDMHVNVKLVQGNGEKFLKLTPVCKPKKVES